MNNKPANIACLSALFLATTAGIANAEVLNVPAKVTVDNTIDFTMTGELNFGTLRATADNSATKTCVGITLPADANASINSTLGTDAGTACATGAGNAVLQSVGGSIERPKFKVAGLAPFTKLKLTLPSSGGEMSLSPQPPGSSVFQLHDFTGYQTSGTPGAVSASTGIVADTNGDIEFTVGATIITDPTNTATADYQNAEYAGAFDVEVTY